MRAFLLVLLAACEPGAGSEPDAAPPPVSVLAPFSLRSGQERYLCLRATTTETLLVSALEAAAPAGVHHLILGSDLPDGPDGVTPCSEELPTHHVLFAAARGTRRLELPPGVAFRVPAGRQLSVQMHLVDASDGPLAGNAGFSLTTLPPGAAAVQADILFAGKPTFVVPPGRSTQVGRCPIRAAATLVAVAPHMHSLGVRQRVVLESPEGERTLLDTPFDLDDQDYHRAGAELAPGDTVRVECDYDNRTGEPVRSGTGSRDEMCYARMIFYPPVGGAVICGG